GPPTPDLSCDTICAVQRRIMVLVNRVVNRIVRLLRLQRFRGARLLYLTTVGRKSGKARTVPLAFVRDGEDYVVAASNGGSGWEPGWWVNLQSESDAKIHVDDADVAITASAVAEPDRAELWQRLSDQL